VWELVTREIVLRYKTIATVLFVLALAACPVAAVVSAYWRLSAPFIVIGLFILASAALLRSRLIWCTIGGMFVGTFFLPSVNGSDVEDLKTMIGFAVAGALAGILWDFASETSRTSEVASGRAPSNKMQP
jgi:hypothetical protein